MHLKLYAVCIDLRNSNLHICGILLFLYMDLCDYYLWGTLQDLYVNSPHCLGVHSSGMLCSIDW